MAPYVQNCHPKTIRMPWIVYVSRFKWMSMSFDVFGLWDVTRTHDMADCPTWWVFIRFGDAFHNSFVTDLNTLHILEMLDTRLHHFEFVIW
jgi:hypothetical protein